MAKKTDNWWRPEGRNPFGFDPTQPLGPQIFAAVWQLGVIFGGPLLGLVTINKYPFLVDDRNLYVVGLSSIAFCQCEVCRSSTQRFPLGYASISQTGVPRGL